MATDAVPTWRQIGQRMGLIARAHALTPITETLRRKGVELAERRVAENLTRAKATTWGNAGWSIVRGTQPSDFQQTGTEVRRLGWERHPVVNACARVVVELITSIPLEAYRLRSDGTADVLAPGKSEGLALLKNPRVGLSGARLIGRTANQFFIYGNGTWVLERNGRRGIPRGIRVVPAEDLQFVWLDANTDAILSYDWRDLQGRTHPHEPVENVVHFRDLDATDGLFGYPRLAAALLDISADSEASQYVRQVVSNHGVPGMIVNAESGTQEGDLQAAEARWREKYTERGMRGMTAFMSGLKSVEQIGFDLQQLEFPDLRRVSREDICAAANVDPRMISVSSAANDGGLSGEQYREARHRLIQQTVYPIMRAIEDELNYWFMPEFGEPLVRFSEEYIAAITEDVTQTSTRVLAELAGKARTVEETREAVGLPAEMDPTHTLPGGLTVREVQQNAQAMAAALVEAKRNPAPAPNAPPAKPDETTRAAVRPAARALVRSYSDDAAGEWEQEFERAALLLFAADRADVLRVFATVAAANAVMSDPVVATTLARIAANYGEQGAYYQRWLERYSELIGRAVTLGGRGIASSVGLDFSLQNPRVRGIIQRRAGDLVTNVSETTRESIRAAVLAGREQGLGVGQVATLIEDTTFGAITGARAKTIARTEAVGALNAGEFAAAVQSGVMRSKTWLTQQDARVRDSHDALEGVTVDIGAAFPNGLRYPHDPLGSAAETINCRCTCTYSDEEAT